MNGSQLWCRKWGIVLTVRYGNKLAEKLRRKWRWKHSFRKLYTDYMGNLSHSHNEWLTYIKTCMVLMLHRYPVRWVSFVFECLVTLVAFGRSACGGVVVVDIDIEAASDGGNGC
uniref:Uncharacterized protein n=1 Tax=Glossina austeni TaxID=7395 RepID=A0A1A9V8K7_GLOAU